MGLGDRERDLDHSTPPATSASVTSASSSACSVRKMAIDAAAVDLIEMFLLGVHGV